MTDTAALHQVWTSHLAPFDHSVLLDWRPVDGAEVSVRIDPDRAYSGASMIKSWLAEMVSLEVDAGLLDWNQTVTVRPEELTVGDGVLGDWRTPADLSLYNLVHLMVAISDNSATNTVAVLLGGVEHVNDRLAQADTASRMRRWVGGKNPDPRWEQWLPDASLPSPPGLSVVVPAEHHALIGRVAHDPRHEVLRRLFAQQQDRRGLVRHLDERLDFPRKTGTVDGVRHDSGVLVVPQGELAVTVFTDGPDDLEGVDHPACVAMGAAMDETCALLGLNACVVGGHRRVP